MEKIGNMNNNNGRKQNHEIDEKKLLREEKQRDNKLMEQIEKLLNSIGNSSTTSEEKNIILARNVVTLDKDYQKQITTTKQAEKQMESIVREKELLQKEYNRGILIRDKLEQVCREQQKLMKSIKAESMTKIREEEEKRKEIQARFQQSINEIFATLNKNNEENAKLKETNTEMTKKFKFLAEQYQLREKQLEKIQEQINLETQLNEAKLTKVKMETTIERDILLREKAAALEDLLTTKKTLVDMQTREKILRDQLSLYTDKYEDFQSSLKKSNDIFTTYKSEIEKVTKRTKNLEKESYEWRVKFEKSNKALLDMAADKQTQDQYVAKITRQLVQLQKLSRTLQMDRTTLLDVLKSNNIERPPMPELPPPEPSILEPPQPPKSMDKLDIMTKNCTDLKKTLAQLQGQVNALVAEKDKNDENTNNAGNNINNSSTNTTNKKNKNKNKKSTKVCPTKEKLSTVNATSTPPPPPQPAVVEPIETNKTTTIEQFNDTNIQNKILNEKQVEMCETLNKHVNEQSIELKNDTIESNVSISDHADEIQEIKETTKTNEFTTKIIDEIVDKLVIGNEKITDENQSQNSIATVTVQSPASFVCESINDQIPIKNEKNILTENSEKIDVSKLLDNVNQSIIMDIANPVADQLNAV